MRSYRAYARKKDKGDYFVYPYTPPRTRDITILIRASAHEIPY